MRYLYRTIMTRNRNLASISISNTISVTANGFWIMFMPLYFGKIGFTTGTIALIYTVSSVLTASFYFCGGLISDKFGRRPSALIGRFLGVLGVFFVLLSSVLSLSTYLARFFVLWGFFHGIFLVVHRMLSVFVSRFRIGLPLFIRWILRSILSS